MSRRNGVYQELAAFIRNTSLKDFPREVVSLGKKALLDLLGCMIAGSETPIGKRVAEYVRKFFSGNESTIIGSGVKVNQLGASLANGYSANALDADDGHRGAVGHPGAVVVPAALALAEKEGVNGRDFLRAVIIGYEVAIRFGELLNINPDRIYFGSAHWAGFGAVAACSNILELSEEQIINALGIMEIQTPSSLIMGWIESKNIPMVKEGTGWGAMTGLASVLMAANGISGKPTLLKGKGTRCLQGLSSVYEFSKLYFKKYCACRWAHPSIDLSLQIREKEWFSLPEVKKIRVLTFRHATFLSIYMPETIEEAQYSIPFLVATALKYGSVGPNELCETCLRDEEILNLARKVEIIEKKEFTSIFPSKTISQIEIEMKNGKKYLTPPHSPHGDPDKPLTLVDIKRKFRSFTKKMLPSERVDELINAVERIEKMGCISELTVLTNINY